MTLKECQEQARKQGAINSMEFDAYFPSGWKKCLWVDAVEGWFTVEGVTKGNSFLIVDEVLKMGSPVCVFLRRKK